MADRGKARENAAMPWASVLAVSTAISRPWGSVQRSLSGMDGGVFRAMSRTAATPTTVSPGR